MYCPRCGRIAHQVFFGDGVERWGCMACQVVFTVEMRTREELEKELSAKLGLIRVA